MACVTITQQPKKSTFFLYSGDYYSYDGILNMEALNN